MIRIHHFFRLLYSFNTDRPSTVIYSLSLHDALPIFARDWKSRRENPLVAGAIDILTEKFKTVDRKSTRLNSSHLVISYAVFCLKKKNITELKTALTGLFYDDAI